MLRLGSRYARCWRCYGEEDCLGIAYGRQAVTIEEDGDDGDSDVQMNDEVNITRGPN